MESGNYNLLICASETGAHHCLGKRHMREGAFLSSVLLDIHGSRKDKQKM